MAEIVIIEPNYRYQNSCINTATIGIECLQPVDGRQTKAKINEGHQLTIKQLPIIFQTGHSTDIVQLLYIKPVSIPKRTCTGLEITRKNTLEGIPDVCCLGDYTPATRLNFPVYLTFKNDPGELIENVKSINLLGQHPYALLIATRKRLTSQAENLLRR